ncbi:MAG: hypothetical protein ACYTG2_17795 [Planctomycetota bacterium]|jgi:hypothetical protein
MCTPTHRSSSFSTAGPPVVGSPSTIEPPGPDAVAVEDVRPSCILWVPSGLGNKGFLILTNLHRNFFVELPPRFVEYIVELKRLRDLCEGRGHCEALVGWTSLEALADGVAAAIEGRSDQRVAPVGKEAVRRYLREILKALAGRAEALGVPWDSGWFLERRPGLGVRLVADLEIRVGPM